MVENGLCEKLLRLLAENPTQKVYVDGISFHEDSEFDRCVFKMEGQGFVETEENTMMNPGNIVKSGYLSVKITPAGLSYIEKMRP